MTTKDDFVGCAVINGIITGGPFGDNLGHSVAQAWGWVNPDHSVGPNGYAFHTGLDIQAAEGTPLVALGYGTVLLAMNSSQEGNLVIITYGDLEIHYYHMRDAALVASGQAVTPGQVVGYVGTTGNSTGPHLHFQIVTPPRSAQTIDPLPWLTNLNPWGYTPPTQQEVTVTDDANHTDNYDVGYERIILENMLRIIRDEHLRAKGDKQVLIDIINGLR